MATAVELAAERKQKLLVMTQAKVGKERVGLGTDPRLTKKVVPLNVLGIDDILGGGLRKGRMAIVVGPESAGKTLLAQWTMKAFQEAGELCGYIDAERTYDPTWFAKTGVNVDDLLVVQPGNTEQAYDLCCLWAQNDVGLIVIDSMTALVPKSRIESELEDQEFMGLAARKNSDGLRQFVNTNTDSFLMCISQLRSKIGVSYGSPDEIPGGRAQRFYMSYIIHVRRRGWIRDGDRRVGYHMFVEAQKNKTNQPYLSTIVPFMYETGVDEVAGLMDMAFDLNLIEGRRGYYEWEGVKHHGKGKLTDLFRTSPEDLAVLRTMVEMGELPAAE